MISDILPGVLTPSGIIGENIGMLNWQIEVLKSIELKGTVNCGQCVVEKNKFPPI